MRSLYTVRFGAGGPSSTTGAHALGTVPSGRVWVVRDLEGYRTGAGAGIGLWHLGPVYGVEWNSAAGEQTFQWEGRVVLLAGEALEFQLVSGTWYWIASGYELVV